MTNIFGSPQKVLLRDRLKEIGVQALEREGWTVTRIPGSGKASLRRISRGSESLKVAFRTSQDTWIAFPRTPDDKSWRTLAEVDAVVAVSVDDKANPRLVLVHMLPGDEMRDRFERAYRARRKADHKIPVGRGVWLALYDEEASSPPRRVGAGAGLKHPAFAKVPLTPADLAAIRFRAQAISSILGLMPASVSDEKRTDEADDPDGDAGPTVARLSDGPVGPVGPGGGARPDARAGGAEGETLTIAEAKRRLALTFGVDVASIKITVEA